MTPVSQIGCRPGRAPGPHLPGELERAISGSCSAWPVLPTVTLTHTRSRPLGTAGWEEERLSFTLTQLLREGFLSLVQALRPALGSGGGSERCWRRADPALGLPLTLEFFNRHHLRRFGPELESFGGLGGGGGSGGGARSLER